MAEWIDIAALDGSGSFKAYHAAPDDAETAPVVVVIQEIFGVNAGIQTICDRWAANGFHAIAPDIFWRQQPGVSLTDKSEAEWQQAFSFYQGFNVDKGIEDVEATIRAGRALSGSTGMVGVSGYCLGGLLTYLSATRTDADAGASYYGGGIDGRLHESHAIARPLMLHLAVEDEYINAEAQAKIHAELDGHARVTIHDYPGVDHAFARINGIHRNDAAADLADSRTLAFFCEHLA